jgi:hypothetical protein
MRLLELALGLTGFTANNVSMSYGFTLFFLHDFVVCQIQAQKGKDSLKRRVIMNLSFVWRRIESR